MRINRYLAAAGLGSRRACEELVLEGRVTINGKSVDSLATVVAPGDVVKVGGRVLKVQQSAVIALYKPRGIVTTCSDPEKRRTVIDFMPPGLGRLFPVGRLDLESEGLLILTNDGALAQQLAHPSHSTDKEYEVTLDKEFDSALIPKLLKGFVIEGGKARAEKVYPLAKRKLKVVLRQGIKRQIRLMFYELGYEVQTLKRVRIGGFLLGKMRPGEWQMLKKADIGLLTGERPPTPRKPSTPRRKASAPAPKPRPSRRA